MGLKAKKPEQLQKRLKLLLYGDAGVGKSTACCQMPSCYIIDGERGTENYSDLINESGGVVFQTTDMSELIEEVRKLRTEKHDFITLVIDPITTLYNDLAEKCEEEVGNEWGKHYAEANKSMKRLCNLLMDLDMNIVMTAHGKTKWEDDKTSNGITFDAWKKLDYIFDLVLELRKVSPTKRKARVIKTRMSDMFPDGDSFEWSYEELSDRFPEDILNKKSEPVKLINKKQKEQITNLSEKLSDGQKIITRCLKKENIDDVDDLSTDRADAMIKYFHKELGLDKETK